MRRMAAAARGDAALPLRADDDSPSPVSRATGGLVGLASIDSIGVARPAVPPYSPIDCEIAPMLAVPPAPSGQ
jgi:hypothetical protein